MASVRKRTGTKYWIGCFALPNGERKQRSTRATNRKLAEKIADGWETAARNKSTADQAQKVLADIVKEVTGETFVIEDANAYLDRWLERKCMELKPGTLTRYRRVVKDFKDTLTAGVPMAHLSKSTIAKFRDAEAKRTSISSANMALAVLKSVFGTAWEDGVIGENIAKDVPQLNEKMEQATRAQRRPFTLKEVGRLFAATPIDDEWYGIQLFGFYSGQRLSDIATAEREKISKHGIWEDVSKKTGAPIRVALPGMVLDWIEKHAPKTGPIFPRASATPHVGTLSNRFYTIMHRAELVPARSHKKKADGQGRRGARASSEITFHCMRHTTQTLLIEAGVSRPMAMAYVGHEDEDTSKDYTHIGVEALRTVMAKLPDVTRLAA